jgi:hypothetical protein
VRVHAAGGVQGIDVFSRDSVQRDLIEDHRSSRPVNVNRIDATVSVATNQAQVVN